MGDEDNTNNGFYSGADNSSLGFRFDFKDKGINIKIFSKRGINNFEKVMKKMESC